MKTIDVIFKLAVAVWAILEIVWYIKDFSQYYINY